MNNVSNEEVLMLLGDKDVMLYSRDKEIKRLNEALETMSKYLEELQKEKNEHV